MLANVVLWLKSWHLVLVMREFDVFWPRLLFDSKTESTNPCATLPRVFLFPLPYYCKIFSVKFVQPKKRFRSRYSKKEVLAFALAFQRRLYFLQGQHKKDAEARKKLEKWGKEWRAAHLEEDRKYNRERIARLRKLTGKYTWAMSEAVKNQSRESVRKFRRALGSRSDLLGKYNNKKKVIDNITFDSMREADRYLFLRKAQEKGVIRDLKCHVRFPLIDKRTGEHLTVQGPKRKSKCVYTCDFHYYVVNGALEVIEDVKSAFTASSPYFRFRRATFEYLTGKRIRVVYSTNTEPGNSAF